jgi:hypothetical protein
MRCFLNVRRQLPHLVEINEFDDESVTPGLKELQFDSLMY